MAVDILQKTAGTAARAPGALCLRLVDRSVGRDIGAREWRCRQLEVRAPALTGACAPKMSGPSVLDDRRRVVVR